MSEQRPSSPPATHRAPVPDDPETARAVRRDLESLVLRMRRLAEAGIVGDRHRETLEGIVGQLQRTRQLLTARSPRYVTATAALERITEQVDGLARTHQTCVYGPALADLAEQITATTKSLVG